MRRALALSVLLAGGWSQVLASDCAMGPGDAATRPGTAHQAPVAAPSHEHGPQAHPLPTSAGPTGSTGPTRAEEAPPAETSHHPDTSCRLLLPCVLGVLPAERHDGEAPAPVVRSEDPPAAHGSRTSPLPAQDPPPPRLPV